MFIIGEGNLREELGLTVERGNELVRIVNSIMDQDASNEDIGRTSHVLLDIASRKDLSDVEKVACSFIFACRISDDGFHLFSENSESDHISILELKTNPVHDHFLFPEILPDFSGTTKAKFEDSRNELSGMAVGPLGLSKEMMISVLMASVTSILRELPKDQAQEFCRNVGFIFARMALSGDMKL